jgi:signal transduction histidine kinase
MGALARRVVDALHATIDGKKAKVAIDELPPALGDAAAVEQVLANLIGNSLNYLDPARPGRIEIGSRDDRTPPNGAPPTPVHTYFVWDNGIGIAPPYLPKLFQAFQRLHPDKTPGEGIGLAIARRVLERHGGQIWAESTEGEGTTFFFTLPTVTPGAGAP